jgi:hypothetical protein
MVLYNYSSLIKLRNIKLPTFQQKNNLLLNQFEHIIDLPVNENKLQRQLTSERWSWDGSDFKITP